MQTSKLLRSALELDFAVHLLTAVISHWDLAELERSHQCSSPQSLHQEADRSHQWEDVSVGKLLAVNVIRPGMTALPSGPAKRGSLCYRHCWEVTIAVGAASHEFLENGYAEEPTQRNLPTPLHSCSQDRIQTKSTEMKKHFFLIEFVSLKCWLQHGFNTLTKL